MALSMTFSGQSCRTLNLSPLTPVVVEQGSQEVSVRETEGNGGGHGLQLSCLLTQHER